MSFPSPPRIEVGYALAPKKIETFIQPSLVAYAADHGVDLIPIDPDLPLSSQGPFHCILHKLRSSNWTSQLLNFISQNPNLPIIDPPDSVEPVNNRITMLDAVNRIALQNPPKTLTIEAPKQAVLEHPEKIESLGFQFPLIAKSVASHGSSDSHEMSLVYSVEGLKDLKLPVVLQEFTNHGGVIFKIYVAGRRVECTKRRSLPDVSEEELRGSKRIMTFSQISNLSKKDPEVSDEITDQVEAAELPPREFVMDVSRRMRKALGLRLFNFDMIRDSRDGDRYLIIDINYFPGFAKVPGYEKMMTEFLWDVVNGKEEEDEESGGNE